MTKVYWAKTTQSIGEIYGARTEQGLCFLGGPQEDLESLTRWVHRSIPAGRLLESPEKLAPYFRELQAYLAGEGQDFQLPVVFYGTPFQQKVWTLLQAIPYGATTSYSEIAHQLKKPKAVRAVGGAVGANPLLFVVPCHRVIQKDGRIGGFRGGISLKESLLALESNNKRSD